MQRTSTDIEIKVLEEECNTLFKKVEASKLSLDDDFITMYNPQTARAINFQVLLIEDIKSGRLKDFWAPIYDPSFTNVSRTKIFYSAGEKPAVGKSIEFWKNIAVKLNLRVGTKRERRAFLACIMKEMVSNGWSARDVWMAMCEDSKALGHYWDSPESQPCFERTGSRVICDFCDLGNTHKMVADDENDEVFWISGGYYGTYGECEPLSNAVLKENPRSAYYDAVGWLIRDCT